MNTANFLPPEIESDDLLDFAAELEQAARLLDLDPWTLQRLKHPEREITVNLPLVRDNGETVNVTGYRVQHSRAHGPSIGPLLLSPEAHLAHLRAQAADLTLQCALLDLPLGGAAGALVVDVDDLSERELRHLVKDYVAALRHVLGPMGDVLAPLANDCIAAWMLDGYTRASGRTEPAAVVGKPAALGGLPDAQAAIAGAEVALIEQALAPHKLSLAGARLAIQGFGTATGTLAQRLHAAGARLVAVADCSGGLLRAEGIDVQRLWAYRESSGAIFSFDGAEAATNADVLACDCDVLVAAAAARQVTANNAQRIRARVLLEGAAGAVTPAAENVLAARGVEVVPALIATAATLRAWALEWEFGLRYAVPEPHDAEAVVCSRVVRAYEETRERAHSLQCTPRTAAQIIALEKLAAALRLR